MYIFKWDCGTFWEAPQKQSEFLGRSENVVFKMEVGVRCLDVWATVAAVVYWDDNGIIQWDVQFVWGS